MRDSKSDDDRRAMTAAFARAIRDAVARAASLGEIAELLRAYKNDGLSRAEAYGCLEALRDEVGEPDEDRVLEVMDIVVDWCAPRYRVW